MYVNLVLSELSWNLFKHLWIIHGYWVSIGKYTCNRNFENFEVSLCSPTFVCLFWFPVVFTHVLLIRYLKFWRESPFFSPDSRWKFLRKSCVQENCLIGSLLVPSPRISCSPDTKSNFSQEYLLVFRIFALIWFLTIWNIVCLEKNLNKHWKLK